MGEKHHFDLRRDAEAQIGAATDVTVALVAFNDTALQMTAASPRLSPEQIHHRDETNAILASIADDIEGDLLDLDGDANESALAGQRLAALAPKLFSSFNSASGLTQMVELAQAKREAKATEDDRIEFQQEQEKRKKEDAEKSREDWDDYAENVQQRIRADRAATQSQSSLDAMEWEGNSYEVWDFGSMSKTRKDSYNRIKGARANIDQLAKENGWTEAERAHEERLMSDMMRAIKANDYPAAQQAWKGMKPESQKAVMRDSAQEQKLVAQNLNEGVVLRASSRQSGTEISVDARADMFATVSPPAPPPAPAAVTPMIKALALSNSPKVNLSDDFTVAAADKPVAPALEPALQLVSGAAAPKAAAPALNQEFSFS